MKELTEYRKRLMEHLRESANEFREHCLKVKDAHAPLTEEGWSTHQMATHTRDVNDLVYATRVRRTAAEDNPEFENFDGEAHMAEHYNPEVSIDQIVSDLVADVESLYEFLQSLPRESWSRGSRHATFGSGFTLQTWVERAVVHIDEHLQDVKKS